MSLKLELIHAAAPPGRWVQKPFDHAASFNSGWWVGTTHAPVVWCSIVDPGSGEVARAQVRPGSRVGAAYPTHEIPWEGATEIDLLEVRSDLQRRGLELGAATLALIAEAFPGPYVALSLDSETDGFWRRMGWEEHDHEERAEALADDSSLPAQLFASPDWRDSRRQQ